MARRTETAQIDLQVGKLTVLSYSHSVFLPSRKVPRYDDYWLCKCECGTVKAFNARALLRNLPQSCGCFDPRLRHGHAGQQSPEYMTWVDMKRRCSDASRPNYRRYGGRGVTVCERWLDSFESFLSDMGLRPSGKHSIDRIDNNGNYEPGNCRWATCGEQSRNMASNNNLTLDGETLCVTDWAAKAPVTRQAVTQRIRRGWQPKEAITVPAIQGRPR